MKRRQFLNGPIATILLATVARNATVSHAQSNGRVRIGKSHEPPSPNPAVMAAIKDLKATLKAMAGEQRISKKTRGYSAKMRAYPENQITVLHVLYQKMRQTKRPHIRNEKAWFDAEGKSGATRQKELDKAFSRLAEQHPEAVTMIFGQSTYGLRLRIPTGRDAGSGPKGGGMAALTSDDLVALLEAGFSTPEIKTQLTQRGYSGMADIDALKALKNAGADADLILEVRKLGNR